MVADEQNYETLFSIHRTRKLSPVTLDVDYFCLSPWHGVFVCLAMMLKSLSTLSCSNPA